MVDKDYSEKLRALSNDYYQNRIGFKEYRERRKLLLDEIDAEFNGWHEPEPVVSEKEDSSLFRRAIGLFKANDSEN